MIKDWQKKEDNEILFKSAHFWWITDHNFDDSYVNLKGPLCRKKSCLYELSIVKQDEKKIAHCNKCGEDYLLVDEFEGIYEYARRDFIAKRRTEIKKAINLDKLPTINEELKEEDKYFRVSVERDSENLKDIHIWVGRRKNGGKKAHIILSEDGEIRMDKKDLKPSEEIKSVTSIIYKD